MIKVLNALSLGMLPETLFPATLKIEKISLEQAKAAVASGFESFVGHPDTVLLYSELLGVPVPYNRVSVALSKGERALVGQYIGPRLPDGACKLPEGARIDWLLVTVE